VNLIQITNDSIRSIALLVKLEVLDMVSCPLIDDGGLQFLENGSPSLQVLTLPSSHTKLLWIQYSIFEMFKCYKQEVDVTRCDRVSLSGLISIVRGHPDIQLLKASHCVSVSLRLRP
jgi:F-box/leucine-rich repeat protein 2/20